MTGHEGIIEMRRQGRRPSIVFLNDHKCDTDWANWEDTYATVRIWPADAIETLDMRFLVGMTVSVSADSVDRAKRLLEACKRAGATVVFASVPARSINGRWVPDWTETWSTQVLVNG